jgi:hypothetical protein
MPEAVFNHGWTRMHTDAHGLQGGRGQNILADEFILECGGKRGATPFWEGGRFRFVRKAVSPLRFGTMVRGAGALP